MLLFYVTNILAILLKCLSYEFVINLTFLVFVMFGYLCVCVCVGARVCARVCVCVFERFCCIYIVPLLQLVGH